MKDIKGLTNTRGEENHSWWDHVSLKAGKLMPTRLRSIQKKLEETSLEEFKKWFVSEDYPLMQLNFYKEFNEYYVGADGNHRTVWAKLVNADLIKAVVVCYHLNQLKYEEYKRDKKEKHEKHKKEQKNKKELEKLKNEFERYIQYYGFTIKKDTYIEYQGKYLMNCYPLINDYSQDEVIDYFETYIANTKNQLRDLMTEFCNLKKIPRIWRAIYIKTIAKFSRDSHKRDLYNMLILLYQKDGI